MFKATQVPAYCVVRGRPLQVRTARAIPKPCGRCCPRPGLPGEYAKTEFDVGFLAMQNFTHSGEVKKNPVHSLSRAEIPSIVKVMGELASDPTAQPQSRLKAI